MIISLLVSIPLLALLLWPGSYMLKQSISRKDANPLADSVLLFFAFIAAYVAMFLFSLTIDGTASQAAIEFRTYLISTMLVFLPLAIFATTYIVHARRKSPLHWLLAGAGSYLLSTGLSLLAYFIGAAILQINL